MKWNHAAWGRAFVLASAILFINSSHAQSGYTITERGPDWKVMQKTEVVNGTNRVHKYTELATGLNYTNASGQLVESVEQITILPTGGAAATQGRHKVHFPGDIYNGVLEVVTPDGRHLKSRPLGVSYDDGSNTVFIATLKHAQGFLTSSNTVTYRNAFDGFKADLVCTYRRGGFECDLVFRQQPPTPGDYGLDESLSTLQMVTEFFNTQDPEQVPAAYDDWYSLQDMTLKFGKLTMTHGKAFSFKTNSVSSLRPTPNSQVPVYKSWVKAEGRTFLIEQVPVLDLADDLNALPLTASANSSKPKAMFASGQRQLPPAHDILACTNQILLASADYTKEPGVVLDYNTVDSDQTDFTFAADTTYYLSGILFLEGSTIFEGGTVIKFAADLYCQNPAFQTTTDRPVILTARDDDTVGQVLMESSGIPSGYYGYFCMFNVTNLFVKNVRFSYLNSIYIDSAESAVLSDIQLLNCQIAFGGPDYQNITLNNVLLYNIGSVISDGLFGWNVWCNNSTIHQCDVFAPDAYYGYSGNQFYLTNCLLVAVNALTNSSDTYFTTNAFVWLTNDPGVFQTAGAASHYLVTSSPYRDAGTTSIDASLLAEIQTLTTYAPQDGGYLDTNAPDLGYHYFVNEDSDHDGLPDWWEWNFLGDFSHNGSDIGINGLTLADSYRKGLNPNNPIYLDPHLSFTNGLSLFLSEPKSASLIP